VRALAAFRRWWLRFAYRRAGIAVVNRRLLLAPRCEALLREYGAAVGDDCVVHGPLVIHNAVTDYRNLTIGRNVHIGPLVVLDLVERVSIEDDATLSMGATVLTHEDVGNRPLAADHPRASAPAMIKAGAWIGANATVLCGCEIGERAVVGAGAVVRESVSPGEVVAGVPARPLKRS
jgi:acetyltransferase-like isoleucine patch superfamily enzyme